MASSRTANIYDQHNPQAAARESSQINQGSIPTPPSASSSSHFSPEGQFRVVRRRNRVPLSCAPCRSRKLKCNRSHPCENCVKRGDSMSCSYAQPSARKRSTPSAQSNGGSADRLQNRIDRLEGLVLSLMTNGSESAGPSAANRALSIDSSGGSMQYNQDIEVDDASTSSNAGRQEHSAEESETDSVTQSLGYLRVDGTRAMYIGASHWATLLHDISEIKNYWSDHKKQFEDQVNKIQETKAQMDSVYPGTMFLFGSSKVPDLSEVLAQIPKRSVTDRLVSRYFNSYDPAVHILHPQTWYKQYERHWANPQESTPAWIGQMFAVLCLAMYSYDKMEDEPQEYQGKSLALASHYRALTGQCLLLADFTKPVTHMIETLVLHLHCEYARTRDTEVGVWVLVGMIVRLAMRMGYHRDPKYYSNLSPFQGEMRRRVWTFIRQSDLLFSFQIGLPSMIRQGDCDAELPRNLFDEDLDENSPNLPPSRPATEPTPVSYMRAKAVMSFAFGKVVEKLHLVQNCPYEEIMELDGNLRECLADLPPHLRMKGLEEPITEPGALIMQRFNLSILYHKSQCVLHRKFLTKARDNSRYAHSRRTCIDSSMELLNIQSTLHHESQPGRRLQGMKVFISSLTASDFLMAAMIVALDLHNSSEAEESSSNANDLFMWGSERRSDMTRALDVSRDIWKGAADQSIEAFKASTLLTIMLEKLRNKDTSQGKGSAGAFPFPNSAGATDGGRSFGLAPGEEKPEHSAAMTLGMLSSGGMNNALANQFTNAFASSNGDQANGLMNAASIAASGFGLDQSTGLFSGAMLPGMDANESNFDWDAWDSILQNVNFDAPMNTQPSQQQQQQQQQQNWPSSVDPSLAAVDTQRTANSYGPLN